MDSEAAEYPVIIGLEIHVQLATKSKLFCSCGTDYQNAPAPNEDVCPTCTAQPGTKPYEMNACALEQALKVALALNCEVGERMVMQRKHYFYPDLPPNYQRTSMPLGRQGSLAGVSITEVHIEEDPGRYDLKTGLVDYNRAGVPLLEVVTDPVITSPEHARRFLEELRAVLNYLGAARDVESGSMRADANISIRGHNRVEVKNINSFRGVFSALSYEMSRQKNMIKNGLEPARETRHFDEEREITLGLRRKESVDDYRYFPDPDVQPVAVPPELVARIAGSLPELPAKKMDRFKRQYGASGDEARALCMELAMADAFERIAKKADARLAAGFMRGTLRKQLNFRSFGYEKVAQKEQFIIGLLQLLAQKKVTDKVAEKMLIDLLDERTGQSTALQHAEAAGLLGVQGTGELGAVIERAIAENQKAVADYRAGNGKALQFIAGAVMRLSKGKADPKTVQGLLKKRLCE
jgi:aspartyl-tRNA(Asn)/glutamyl-tRNA(Gln) amidotransferase subunit B